MYINIYIYIYPPGWSCQRLPASLPDGLAKGDIHIVHYMVNALASGRVPR